MAKPKTKEEILIAGLVFADVDFSKIKIFQRKGFETKKGVTCLKCGNTFVQLENKKCPHCREKLKVEKTRKRNLNEEKYIEVITTNGGYQVVRMFLAILEARKYQEEKFEIVEVMRWFISPKGKIKLMTIATTCFFYEWRWVLSRPSDFEFKKITDRYGYSKWKITADITYPKINYIDTFKYCAYNKKSPMFSVSYFEFYLKKPQIEFLAKCGRWEFILYAYRHDNFFDKYRGPIKTVIKNKYKVEDVGIWVDYLKALIYFNKDISSPKWCCPEDLRKAHNRWLEKKKQQIEENDIKAFDRRVSPYEGINLGKGDIEIVAISDIDQMKHEAKILKLCYITSNYYKKENSIVLSARVKGVPTEGIEINLKARTIIQIRGYDNNPSPYHDEIKDLVYKNLNKLFQKKKEDNLFEHINSKRASCERPGTKTSELTAVC